jgi:hypothetical protein
MTTEIGKDKEVLQPTHTSTLANAGPAREYISAPIQFGRGCFFS